MKYTILSLILGLMLLCALTGCSREQAPDVTPTPSSAVSTKPDEDRKEDLTDGEYSADEDGEVAGGAHDPAVVPDHNDGIMNDAGDMIQDAGDAAGGLVDDAGRAIRDADRDIGDALR